MGMIWWILPAVAAAIGIMLGFAGLSKLARLKPVSGGARLLFGTGFLGLAGLVTFTGLNLQTYQRLTKERVVATISFDAVEGQADTYIANLLLPEGEKQSYTFHGDEWLMRARVIKFKPMSNMLGYDSVYRLDRLSGHFEDVDRERAEPSSVERLSANPGLDVHALAKEFGPRFGVRDASYGSAVYNPMGDDFSYEVSITQDALIARPANALTRMQLGVYDVEAQLKAPKADDEIEE
jgi:hypothetical protein